MVFFTVFATIDSMTLLFAMTGLLGSSAYSLKAIADLEYDLINSVDFFKVYNQAHRIELAFIALNALSVLPFVANWWLSPIQLLWAVVKVLRGVSGGNQIDEKDVFKPEVYGRQRRWQMAGFFIYLVSIFIYFARAMCAVMDIHVHGISPYD
ncbi:unnamed protein product [Symbiodinium microadriaticum]|nr:unnamed protein product [Symbiodinium sp. KB8]CAE7872617.1 unnamed protein product [Symbiodinium microadriaticum]